MKLKYIKKLVENISGVDDIGIVSRERKISDKRHVFFALCREFSTQSSQTEMAQAVNRINHTSVINGLNKFDSYKNMEHYRQNRNIYNSCFKILSKIKENEFRNLEFSSLSDVEMYYRIKMIMHTEKSHQVIKVLQNRISNLTKEIKTKL